MVRPSVLIVGLLVAASLAALAGCKKTPGDFCCVTQASCDEYGDGKQVPCPTGQVCDEEGKQGIGNVCVAEPQCETAQECTDPMRPICVNHVCKECEQSAQCPATAPVCEIAANDCVGCKGEADCGRFSDAPHCATSGACAECRDAADCSSPSEPVCDMGSCRGCKADSECTSGSCDRDAGSCVPESQVVYVARGGNDGGMCTKGAPCATIIRGVAMITATTDDRAILHVAESGTAYTEEDTIDIDGQTVTVLGWGATLTPKKSGDALKIIGGAKVTIKGLRVTGTIGTSSDAVQCEDDSTLGLSQVTLESNAGIGMNVLACTFSAVRSMIRDNKRGGVKIDGGTFTLRNNFIVENGTEDAPTPTDFGGVKASGAPGSTLEFNTISGNKAGAGVASGVQCSVVGGELRLASNIIHGNKPTALQVLGTNCKFAYSVIGPQAAPIPAPQDGGNNITDRAPTFGTSYHLTAGSPGIDAAEPTSTLVVDFDGDPRPQPTGGLRDCGADEHR